MYAGLRIDAISDEYPDAQIVGVDGPGTPHEFWDDLISVGTQILERPGQLEAVLDFLHACSAVRGHAELIAKFMKYKDEVSYNGAPATLNGNGEYSDCRRGRHELGDRARASSRKWTAPGSGRSRQGHEPQLVAAPDQRGRTPHTVRRTATSRAAVLDATLTFPLFRPAGYDSCELTRQRAVRRCTCAPSSATRLHRPARIGVATALAGVLGGAGAVQEDHSQIMGFDAHADRRRHWRALSTRLA